MSGKTLALRWRQLIANRIFPFDFSSQSDEFASVLGVAGQDQDGQWTMHSFRVQLRKSSGRIMNALTNIAKEFFAGRSQSVLVLRAEMLFQDQSRPQKKIQNLKTSFAIDLTRSGNT